MNLCERLCIYLKNNLNLKFNKKTMDNLGYQWFQIFDKLQKKPRAWWIREDVWIPLIHCESVLEHSFNVERWAEATVTWGFLKIDNKITFPIKWKVHDILECDMLDVTPHCWISDIEKLEMELEVLYKLRILLWKEWKSTLDLVEEYVYQKTDDSKLLTLLDKMDAWVKALEYEKIWFKKWVAQFHPYVLDKLSENKKLKDIYNILLEREFTSLNYHFQYFTLLQLWWDYDVFRKTMINLLEN